MPHDHLPQDTGPACAMAEPTQPAAPMSGLAHTARHRAATSYPEQGQDQPADGDRAIDAPPGPHRRAPVPADHNGTGLQAGRVRDSVPRSKRHPIQAGAEWSVNRTDPGTATDQPTTTGPERAIRSWPLVLLAAPAAVAVWSGWVGIGRMTGFGQVRPLPGIWDSLHLDSAITLPVGVEAYGAYALRAWLSAGASVTPAARRFARWSAIASLLLGMAGQVAYHLLTEAKTVHAPWEITTVVSCLPVLVLGMGTALAHLLRTGPRTEAPVDPPVSHTPDPATDRTSAAGDRGLRDGNRHLHPASSGHATLLGERGAVGSAYHSDQSAEIGPGACYHRPADGPVDPRLRWPEASRQMRLARARSAAGQLIASGERVSRRTLRGVGVKGSNADLGALARIVSSELASVRAGGDA